MARRWPAMVQTGAMALILFLAFGFVLHAASFGWRGLTGTVVEETHLVRAGAWVSGSGIFLHMLAGAVITLLAPVQLIPTLRRKWPAVHRWSGRVLVVCALPAAIGGLVYIGLRGTAGGAMMDVSFALYGALVLLASVQTIRFARTGAFVRHRAWALRLFVLALGSWFYRLHYGLWFLTTGGIGVADGFTGPFDRVQNLAFFVPYLAVVEVILWRERVRRAPRSLAAS